MSNPEDSGIKEDSAPSNGVSATNGSKTNDSTSGHHDEGEKPMPRRETAEPKDDQEDPDEVEGSQDDPDEEDQFFANLEKDQEEEEQKDGVRVQPKDYHVAPKLLQSELEKGNLADDSEEESDNEKKTGVAESPSAVAPSGGAGGEALPSPPRNAPPHYHSRANQLDFLLSKASEYSNFIARDLDELQSAMAEDARKKIEKINKKKRKADDKPGSKKKQKSSAGASELEKAKAKDAQVRAGSKPIFVQPPNLADGCILKDYQLEGVRWLASLFENGVSGILADEMGLGKTIQCVALIAHLLTMGVLGPFLIVAPLATLPNWVREIEKWLPSQPVVRYHGAANDREAMLRGPLNAKLKKNKNFPIIVTSYEVAIRDQNKLEVREK